MSKPTQAHLERTLDRNQSLEARQLVLKRMHYYMGAKLMEVGVNPQSPEVLYRWSVKTKENEQICTLSAFWGQSKEELLSGKNPLTGEELINCAKPNASKGITIVAQLCGYASDIEGFRTALKEAMTETGIEHESLDQLLKEKNS